MCVRNLLPVVRVNSCLWIDLRSLIFGGISRLSKEGDVLRRGREGGELEGGGRERCI